MNIIKRIETSATKTRNYGALAIILGVAAVGIAVVAYTRGVLAISDFYKAKEDFDEIMGF